MNCKKNDQSIQFFLLHITTVHALWYPRSTDPIHVNVNIDSDMPKSKHRMNVTKQYFAQLSHRALLVFCNENERSSFVSKIILETTMVKIPKTRYSIYSEAITTRGQTMEPPDHQTIRHMGVIYKKFLWYETFYYGQTMYAELNFPIQLVFE